MMFEVPPVVVHHATWTRMNSYTFKGGFLDQHRLGRRCCEIDKVVEDLCPRAASKKGRDLVCHMESDVSTKLDGADWLPRRSHNSSNPPWPDGNSTTTCTREGSSHRTISQINKGFTRFKRSVVRAGSRNGVFGRDEFSQNSPPTVRNCKEGAFWRTSTRELIPPERAALL